MSKKYRVLLNRKKRSDLGEWSTLAQTKPEGHQRQNTSVNS